MDVTIVFLVTSYQGYYATLSVFPQKYITADNLLASREIHEFGGELITNKEITFSSTEVESV